MDHQLPLKMVKTMARSALLLALTVSLSCGPGENSLVLSVGGTPSELAFWEELVEDFEKENGIPTELLRQPTDTEQRRQGLVLALKAGKPNPDVFLMDVAWMGLFTFSGWLEDLGKDVDTSPFFQGVLHLVDIYRGKIVALPVYLDAGLLYYREDLLRRFQHPLPPRRWDELLSVAREIQQRMRNQAPRFYGFVWQGAQYEGLICNFLEFAGSKGGFVVREDGILLNCAENRRALKFMQSLIWDQAISPPSTFTEMKEEETRAYFQAGDALFERNWPYAWALHQSPESEVRGKVGVAPMPAPPNGESVSTLGGWHIGVSRFSDRKEEAKKLVAFITSYETQKRLLFRLGWNPGRRDLYSDAEVLEKAPHFNALKTVFQKARPRPIFPYYTQVSEIAQRHINRVLARKAAPAEALSEAEKDISALVMRYKVQGDPSTTE